MSIMSLIYSFYNYFPFTARYRFISKLLRFSRAKKEHTLNPSTPLLQHPTTTSMIPENDEDDFLVNITRRKAFVQWLQRDGVFLLHLLNTHAGERMTIKCLENLIEIWSKNYEEKSKLAEKLLRNQFHFSK